MIDVTLGQIDVRTELFQCGFEAFRRGDGADRADKSVTQALQWHFFPSENILQIQWLVRAFDNLGGAIVTTNPFHKSVVGFPCVFRDEDVAGTSKISWRLPPRPTG